MHLTVLLKYIDHLKSQWQVTANIWEGYETTTKPALDNAMINSAIIHDFILAIPLILSYIAILSLYKAFPSHFTSTTMALLLVHCEFLSLLNILLPSGD